MENEILILVVDDDETLRNTLGDMLARKYKVLRAGSGYEAIEVIKKNPVDIVLSDVRMPQGSGVDLLNWIHSVNPDYPVVVFVSGHTDIKEEAAIQAGAHSVIAKPFKSKALFEVIEKIIQTQVLPYRASQKKPA